MTSHVSHSFHKSHLQTSEYESDQSKVNDEPLKGQKIFISGVNSLVGHSLFEELRNDHIAIHTGELPNKFLGTINQKDADTVPVPSPSI